MKGFLWYLFYGCSMSWCLSLPICYVFYLFYSFCSINNGDVGCEKVGNGFKILGELGSGEAKTTALSVFSTISLSPIAISSFDEISAL